MKKLIYLIVLTLILGLVLTGCFLSNVGQVPTNEQSGITYLTKNPSPSGLVGLWHFDGNALDSSGNGNHGTLTNMSPPGCWVSGMFGNALSFDGINDYVDCKNESLNITDTITVEAWVKTSLFRTNDFIFGASQFSKGYSLRTDDIDASKLEFYIGDGSSYHFFTYTHGMDTETWYHIVCVYDGATGYIYVDGNEIGHTDDSFTPNGENPGIYAIGTSGGIINPFNGIIDEVRIWDVALTGAEIAYNYVLGDVHIDIKPGSFPNSINLESKGVVPVAILGSATFHVTDVDVETLAFGPNGAAPAHDLTDPDVYADHLQDVNGDSFTDLVCHFKTQELGLVQTSIEATLTGETNGLPFTGTDSVRIVGK